MALIAIGRIVGAAGDERTCARGDLGAIGSTCLKVYSVGPADVAIGLELQTTVREHERFFEQACRS